MKKLFLLTILAAIAVAVFFVLRNKPQVQKLEKQTHSTIAKTSQEITNAVEQGMQKAHELKTNVSAQARAGVEQANKIATNATAQVKDAATNAIHQIKKTMRDANP